MTDTVGFQNGAHDAIVQVLQWHKAGTLQLRQTADAPWRDCEASLYMLLDLVRRLYHFREKPQLLEGWVNVNAGQPACVLHLCRETAIRSAGSACERVAVHVREVE